jgi:hypothetical protein
MIMIFRIDTPEVKGDGHEPANHAQPMFHAEFKQRNDAAEMAVPARQERTIYRPIIN